MPEQKSFLKSKTIWAAVVMAALSAFEPYVQSVMAQHPSIYGSIVAFVVILLRLITTKELV